MPGKKGVERLYSLLFNSCPRASLKMRTISLRSAQAEAGKLARVNCQMLLQVVADSGVAGLDRTLSEMGSLEMLNDDLLEYLQSVIAAKEKKTADEGGGGLVKLMNILKNRIQAEAMLQAYSRGVQQEDSEKDENDIFQDDEPDPNPPSPSADYAKSFDMKNLRTLAYSMKMEDSDRLSFLQNELGSSLEALDNFKVSERAISERSCFGPCVNNTLARKDAPGRTCHRVQF